MPAKILDGRKLAESTEWFTKIRVKNLQTMYGCPVPKLAVILSTEDPASCIYVKRKQDACKRVGVASDLYYCPTREKLFKTIRTLNESNDVHGILVQFPPPVEISRAEIYDAINPDKDVDCFSPANVGLLLQGRPRFIPPTPNAVLGLLNHYALWPSGKNVTIINRSDIVGKPLTALLLRDVVDGNATVTVCHDHTDPISLQKHCQTSDLIVVAVGIPNFLDERHVPKGAVVIDVGINRIGKKVVGDVNFEAVKDIAAALSPVPHGIGPLVTAFLMNNTLRCYESQRINFTAT